MANCSNNFPTTDTLFSEIKDEPAVLFFTVLSGVCLLVIMIMYIEELVFMIRQYNHPEKKIQIITILTLYPVVSAMTFLTLIVPKTTLIADCIVALFLAICILQFTHLIINYFGGDDGLLKTFNGETVSCQTPPCCCCCFCLPEPTLTKKLLNTLKIMVYQLSFVRPLASFLITVLWTDGKYSPDDKNNFRSFAIYLNIISGVSTLTAIYGLLILYRKTRIMLRGRWIISKFLALQLIFVFLSLQNLIIGSLGRFNIPQCAGIRDSDLRASRLHYFILSVEVLITAFLARYAYRRVEVDTDIAQSSEENEEVVNMNYQSPSVNVENTV